MIPVTIWLAFFIINMFGKVNGAMKPPPPFNDHIEKVLMEQYVLQMDHHQPPSPELQEAMRDISRRHSRGSKTTEHYEMDTELFRYILKARSYLYMGSNLIDPLSYLFKSCPSQNNQTPTTKKEEL